MTATYGRSRKPPSGCGRPRSARQIRASCRISRENHSAAAFRLSTAPRLKDVAPAASGPRKMDHPPGRGDPRDGERRHPGHEASRGRASAPRCSTKWLGCLPGPRAQRACAALPASPKTFRASGTSRLTTRPSTRSRSPSKRRARTCDPRLSRSHHASRSRKALSRRSQNLFSPRTPRKPKCS